MRLHYAGYQPNASGFGWATCNSNLVQAIAVQGVGIVSGWHAPAVSDLTFMPLADHDFNPVTPARSKVNLAYTFFEFPLGPHAAENAKKYNTVFAGSTWCLERMTEAGITNGKLLIQGVDQSIFSPQPPRKPDGQFRIFSGGKFEYRKGQDLVIESFEHFSMRHKDTTLVTAWHNPWPQLTQQLLSHLGYNTMEGLLAGVGEVEQFHSLDQRTLAAVMSNTDIGLFPNRCEGGTNLVLMEYASCGRKVVANAKTGHADVAGAISYEIPATTDENHWAVQSVEDIVAMLELAYENRETPEHHSLKAIRDEWTWGRAAETIIAEAQRFL